jgi:hypothetical protein
MGGWTGDCHGRDGPRTPDLKMQKLDLASLESDMKPA